MNRPAKIAGAIVVLLLPTTVSSGVYVVNATARGVLTPDCRPGGDAGRRW